MCINAEKRFHAYKSVESPYELVHIRINVIICANPYNPYECVYIACKSCIAYKSVYMCRNAYNFCNAHESVKMCTNAYKVLVNAY